MILFFYTETNGKIDFNNPPDHPGQPRIVQMAACMANDDAQICGQFSNLIRPQGWTISPELTAIHGFTTEDCESAGVYIKIAMNMISQFASRCNMIVAHNIDFHWAMMNVESVRMGKPIGSIPCFSNLSRFCTMKSSEDICKIPGNYGKYKWPKLRETYSHLFGCEPANQHDAMGDVETCMKCFFAIRKLNLQQPQLDFKPVD